jgi:hypothetical protein
VKLVLESTPDVVMLDGGLARVWRGTTGGGVPCVAFVRLVAVDRAADAGEFDRELRELSLGDVIVRTLPEVLGGGEPPS